MSRTSRIVSALGLGLVVGGASGCFCFVRGTRVATPNGPCRIEDLRVGDEVWSYVIAERRFVARRVAAALRNRARAIVAIRAGEFDVGGVTPEHPFWENETQSWREAGSLSLASTLLVTVDAREVRSQRVTELAQVPTRDEVEVFNLTIEGDEQNYFANGVLVHNKTPLCDACYMPAIDVVDTQDADVSDSADAPPDETAPDAPAE